MLDRPAVAVTLGSLLALVLTLPQALQVLRTGIFLDTDDAMRAVQIRDLMAGQGWFDLVQHRLSPNHPFPMHWSRLVDLPLAGLVRVFSLVLPEGEGAERAMRLVEPCILFVLSLAAMVGLARRLVGPAGVLPAALLLGGSTDFVSSYIPGHIHHHGIQATLLIGSTKLLVDALTTRQLASRALLAGIFAALSLGIGLQNLPFVIGLAALSALAWVVAGRDQARCLRMFGLGLAVTAGAVFLLDVPPSLYGSPVCDAFSAAHLVAACTIGTAFLLLAAATPRIRHAGLRFGLAALAAAATLGLVAVVAPACLHDPMSGVDPVLQAKWLANVGEALPLFDYIHRTPASGIAMLLTLLIGLGATGAAALQSADTRPGWLALLLLGIIGLAGSIWQIRVAGSAAALMIPGVTWAVLACYRRVARIPGQPALLAAVVAGLIGGGAGLTGAAAAVERYWPAGRATGSASSLDPSLCFEPDAFAGLAALRPGLVFSTIDPGSSMLAHTRQSVLAAPYHRNSYGNRVVLLAFDLPPEEARPFVQDSGATYLAICRASNETGESARLHPESLSARLLRREVPAWLVPASQAGALYQVYQVVGSMPRQD